MTLQEKAQSRLADDLVPGERVFSALLAFRTGGVRNTMIAGAAGIAGIAGAAGMALAARRGKSDAPQAPIAIPGRVILTLTSHRLAVFTVGGLVRAAPGKLLHTWTLDRLAWVADPVLVPGMAQALRCRVGVTGVGVLGFEFPRLQVQEGRTMIRRLARSLAELDADPAS
ncbi:hypothetical protein [Amycolatopsis orientalis]|uniref:hypothetical protein n=1 Tax=Amycolatopsis orientalis TaxID=31958 RepID=UPI00039DE8DF|nr:hypothetical protein [Amycolatopsis orientalis]